MLSGEAAAHSGIDGQTLRVTGFITITSDAHICAPTGSRPRMVRGNRHDSAYLFGAICPDRAIGAAIIMPEVSAEAMGHHLKAIAAQVAPGARAVLICDGAGWHQTGGRLRVPDTITLLSLPPYWTSLMGTRQS